MPTRRTTLKALAALAGLALPIGLATASTFGSPDLSVQYGAFFFGIYRDKLRVWVKDGEEWRRTQSDGGIGWNRYSYRNDGLGAECRVRIGQDKETIDLDYYATMRSRHNGSWL